MYEFEDIHTNKFRLQSRYYVKNTPGNHEKQGGLYLQIYDKYGNILNGKTYTDIMEYAKEKSLRISGNGYGECLACQIALEREEDSFVKMYVKVEKE